MRPSGPGILVLGWCRHNGLIGALGPWPVISLVLAVKTVRFRLFRLNMDLLATLLSRLTVFSVLVHPWVLRFIILMIILIPSLLGTSLLWHARMVLPMCRVTDVGQLTLTLTRVAVMALLLGLLMSGLEHNVKQSRPWCVLPMVRASIRYPRALLRALVPLW